MQSEPTQTSTKPNLLIVDDDPTLIQILVEFLQSKFNLSIAKNKKKALSLLDKKHFDIVLLDINLPDGNGIDICAEIKSSREFTDSLSIIIMTSHLSADMEAQGLSVGASDYIYKPIHRSVLMARINIQLDLLRKTQLLAHLANVDALTEIGNRRAFDDQLTQEWFRAKRESKPVSLALLDIDYFKLYNDCYGHPQGDACLKEIAKAIDASCKRHSDFCFRIGGEEFAMLFYGTNSNDACQVMMKLQRTLGALNIPHKDSKVADRVTISIGVSDSLSGVNSTEELVEQTDKLLYKAKQRGRNQIQSSCAQAGQRA